MRKRSEMLDINFEKKVGIVR